MKRNDNARADNDNLCDISMERTNESRVRFERKVYETLLNTSWNVNSCSKRIRWRTSNMSREFVIVMKRNKSSNVTTVLPKFLCARPQATRSSNVNEPRV